MSEQENVKIEEEKVVELSGTSEVGRTMDADLNKTDDKPKIVGLSGSTTPKESGSKIVDDVPSMTQEEIQAEQDEFNLAKPLPEIGTEFQIGDRLFIVCYRNEGRNRLSAVPRGAVY